MDKIKIPEGEKFFLFLVYVALVGAALILLIDYQMKRDIVRIGKEIRGEAGGQGRYHGPANHSGNLRFADPGSVASDDNARVETGNDTEHDPFPVRKVAQPRDASGKFGPRDPDPHSGNGNTPVQPSGQPVES